MSRPDDYRYHESHEWVRVEDDEAVIGITDFAVEQLTDLVFIELPSEGASIKKGQSFGEIESVKAVEELIAPITGTISGIHSEIQDNLDLVMDDPFGEGWMVRVKMSDSGQVNELMDADSYATHVEGDGH